MDKKLKKILAVVMSLAIVLGIIPTMNVKTVSAKTITRYEAEDSNCCDYSHAYQINEWVGDGASGKKAVTIYDSLDKPDQYVVFTVDVPEAGAYNIRMNYAVGSRGNLQTLDIETTVNDGESKKYTLENHAPGNNGWNVFGIITMPMTLKEGKNTIKIQNVANEEDWFVNVDYIETEKIYYMNTIGLWEAENAEQVGFTTPPATSSDDYYDNCSGHSVQGIQTEWIGNVDTYKYISQKVNVEKAGIYNLTLHYCAPSPAEFLIRVNGGEWTYFDDEANTLGHVAPATGNWNVVGTISTDIELVEGENIVNITGSIVDNKSENGNFWSVFGGIFDNAQSVNLDCFTISEYINVTIDGNPIEIIDGKVVLPEGVKYGYYCDGKMYKAGTEVEVASDMAFTSVNDLSVSFEYGAGIRLVDDDKGAGIRFQATVASDNMTAVASDVIKEGMLLTTKDIYESLGNSTLDLTSAYTFKTLENVGWYNDTVGTYCGSVVKIIESNYIRQFIARAYVTITYTDGEKLTVYSTGVSEARSIQYVAEAIKNAGYPKIAAEFIPTIDKFAAAR